MSRRYWLPIIALVGLILSGQQHAQAQGSQRSAAQAQATPQQQSQPSVPPALQNSLDGIRAALEASNNKQTPNDETDRAERDLAAQLLMARAADRMLYIGAAEIIITFIGVMLILATLIYTKRAADAARDAVSEAQAATVVAKENLVLARDHGQQDLRAWVSIDLDLVKVSRSAENALFTIKISLKNIGKTPALNVGVTTKIWASNGSRVGHGPDPIPEKFPHRMIPLLPGADTSERFGLFLKSKEIGVAIENARKEHCSVMVIVDAIVHYQTIFDAPGDPRHLTSIRFDAHAADYDPRRMEDARTWLENGPRDTAQVLFARDKDAPTLMD